MICKTQIIRKLQHLGIFNVYLWGHVVRRPAESVSRLVEVNLELAHPKVGDSYVAFKVQQEVVEFEVSERGQCQ
jgi:hypothetical protein